MKKFLITHLNLNHLWKVSTLQFTLSGRKPKQNPGKDYIEQVNELNEKR